MVKKHEKLYLFVMIVFSNKILKITSNITALITTRQTELNTKTVIQTTCRGFMGFHR